MTETVTAAVAKVQQTPVQLVKAYEERFAAVLPDHIQSGTFMTLALGALRNADLANAARNNPLALMVALTNCARLGHQPNTESFYLVPFKGVITGIEGYRGVIERMYRAGGTSSIHARVVRANDYYEFEEGMQHPIHRYKRFASDADRGERVGVFAYARLRDGGFSEVIEMNADDIARHRAASPGSGGDKSPWKLWTNSMWLKTPARELEKWVPSSATYREQLALSTAAAVDLANDLGAPESATEQMASTDEVLVGEVVWPETAQAGGQS